MGKICVNSANIQKDITVEKEDQLKINQFSRLNMKLTELKEDKKKKQVGFK